MKRNILSGRARNLVIAVVVITIGIAAVAGWQYFSRPAAAASGDVIGSGTIEAKMVNVATEVGGRVLQVNADEGDKVTSGQVIIKIDDSALQAQYAQAKAALAAAQANYNLIAAGPTDDQLRQAEANVIIATSNYSRTTAATRPADIAAAQAALNAAVESYNKVKAGPLKQDYASAEAAYRNAEAALKQAQFAYDAAFRMNPAGIGASPAAIALETATNNFNAAKSLYDKVSMSPDNAQLAVAYQAVVNAQAALDRAQNPARDFDVVQAKAQVVIAQAQLDALKTGARPQQLDAAKAQVDAARAALQAIEVQLKKTTVTAPADGVIFTRSIQPGEIAAPGAALLVIGKLSSLDLTVYVPEQQVGLVTPGQDATVHVDTYANRTFTAKVKRVADQAEFTPRNVSTVEGRKNTVYAVTLAIANPDLALKPGMPADVTFITR